MTTGALDIYDSHLSEQMGEVAPHSQAAIYDPSGANIEIYGIFDDNTNRGNKDAGNVTQKRDGARFMVPSISSLSIDIYGNEELYIVRSDKSFIIDYVETDEEGIDSIWLRESI